MNIEDIAEVEEGDGNEEDDAERDVPVGGENNKKCPYCQKISPSPSKLKPHIITHTKERFSCQHCPKKYSQQHHLKDHVNAIHLGKPNRCPDCNKTFGLRGHLKVQHRE